jgi:cytochrome bd-type quinol oxidase subunit 2
MTESLWSAAAWRRFRLVAGALRARPKRRQAAASKELQECRRMKLLIILAVAIVVLHLLISIPHGTAHSDLHVQMSQWQNAYILSVITILPLLAIVVLWKSRRLGFLLLLISMAGSFLFGVFYHFIATGTDNIAFLPSNQSANTFKLTAVLLAVTEAVGLIIAIIGWSRSRAA